MIFSEPTYSYGQWWGHCFYGFDGESNYISKWGTTSESMNGTYIMGTWSNSVFTATEPCTIYDMSTGAVTSTLSVGQTYTFPRNTYSIWSYLVLPN